MEFDALFIRWQREFAFQAFVKDGIVDPGAYRQILLILRDKNCGDGRWEAGDLRAELRRDGGGWQTWNNAARWVKALLEGGGAYPRHMPQEERTEQMRHIAAINLKKEGGGSRTDGGDLLEAVRGQHELILEEIRLCQPKIILCCGLASPGIRDTGGLLEEFVLPSASGWRYLPSVSLNRDWWYYWARLKGGDVPVVSFCHPQATCLQGGLRGHALFEALYQDVLRMRGYFAVGK